MHTYKVRLMAGPFPVTIGRSAGLDVRAKSATKAAEIGTHMEAAMYATHVEVYADGLDDPMKYRILATGKVDPNA